MRYENVDLHNIQEVIQIEDTLVFSRFPKALHECIHHTMGYQMTGAEIRFVPLEKVYITIGSRFSYIQPKCLVFYGQHMVSQEYCIVREQTIEIEPYQLCNIPFEKLPETMRQEQGFSNEVVRIVLLGEAFYIKSIHGAHRLPKEDEVPRKKLLAYGTSITQGIGVSSPDMAYPWILAQRLGYDCYNYAMSGHAFCETEVADFLANSGAYDIILLEVSVNMLGEGYAVQEFEKRVNELLHKLIQKNPYARIITTSILTSFMDEHIEGQTVKSPVIYRACMEKIIKNLANPLIQYINPFELLSSYHLSVDGIHPSNLGMVEIAEHLYHKITEMDDVI